MVSVHLHWYQHGIHYSNRRLRLPSRKQNGLEFCFTVDLATFLNSFLYFPCFFFFLGILRGDAPTEKGTRLPSPIPVSTPPVLETSGGLKQINLLRLKLDVQKSSEAFAFRCWISGGGSSKNFEGDWDEKFGVKLGYPLENSSVLAHLFTAYGQFCYFSIFFVPLFFLSHFLLLGILGGTSPH